MRFLIKVAFWLTIMVLLLPTDSAKQTQTAQVSPIEALSAAQAAVSDATDFCTRKPDACEIGSQAFQSFGEKAQYGAKLLYEFLSNRFADKADSTSATGSIRERKAGQYTLTPSDIDPAWSGTAAKSVPMPPKRPG
jgi:hypothetical protein